MTAEYEDRPLSKLTKDVLEQLGVNIWFRVHG